MGTGTGTRCETHESRDHRDHRDPDHPELPRVRPQDDGPGAALQAAALRGGGHRAGVLQQEEEFQCQRWHSESGLALIF